MGLIETVKISSMSNSTYDALLAHVRTSRALAQVAGLLSWDQEVMMPPNGAESRAEQAAALEEVTHQRIATRVLASGLMNWTEVS